MGAEILRCNHDYKDRGLAIGRYIFMSNKDKDKDRDKGKETKACCRGRPKDEDRRTRKQIQRLRKEERRAKISRGGTPRLLIDNQIGRASCRERV